MPLTPKVFWTRGEITLLSRGTHVGQTPSSNALLQRYKLEGRWLHFIWCHWNFYNNIYLLQLGCHPVAVVI